MARPDADEISPMMQATLSRSTNRSAFCEAVCGLTESSMTSSTLKLSRGVDLLEGELHPHLRKLAQGAEEAGKRRQMAKLEDILRPQDSGEADGTGCR